MQANDLVRIIDRPTPGDLLYPQQIFTHFPGNERADKFGVAEVYDNRPKKIGTFFEKPPARSGVRADFFA